MVVENPDMILLTNYQYKKFFKLFLAVIPDLYVRNVVRLNHLSQHIAI
jgi:hypothetical protein